MIKSISRTITPKGRRLWAKDKGNYLLSRDRSNCLGIRFPRRKYRVTYQLDPKGKYKMWGKDIVLHTGSAYRVENTGLVVCFLPPEWTGQRVSRKVKVFDAV